MRVRLALVLLMAMSVRGEENCGRMDRYAANFSATVRSVEILGTREMTLFSVDENNLRYAVTLDVAGVAGGPEENSVVKNGQTVAFAVHSPTRTFADAKPKGKTFHMQVVWLVCDSVFRRVEELVPVATRMVEGDKRTWLEVGHIYRMTAVGRSLNPRPAWPHHQAGGVSWTNAEQLLPDDGRKRTVEFEVTEQSIDNLNDGTWLNITTARIRKVE